MFASSNGRRLDNRLYNLVNIIHPSSDDIILDLGCGRGELSYALAKKAKKVIGIDYSKDAINIAKSNFINKNKECENLDYICGDVLQLNTGQKFTKIVMADVYEHIETKAIDVLLGNITQLLDKDGLLYIHTAPNLHYYQKVYGNKVTSANEAGLFLPDNPRSYFEDIMHINEQTPESLKESLKQHFSDAYVWSGDISEIEQLENTDTQDIGVDLTAVAGNHLSVQQVFSSCCYQKINCKQKLNTILKIEKDNYSCIQGNNIKITVEIENLSDFELRTQHPYPFKISYHIYNTNNELVLFEGKRTDLLCILSTNMKLVQEVYIDSDILEAGDYILEITMLQEYNFWLEQILPNSTAKCTLRVE